MKTKKINLQTKTDLRIREREISRAYWQEGIENLRKLFADGSTDEAEIIVQAAQVTAGYHSAIATQKTYKRPGEVHGDWDMSLPEWRAIPCRSQFEAA